MSLVNAELQYFNAGNDLKLYYQKWMPENPKAILVFVHGLADHVGRYGSFTRYFSTRGYGVCLYDMRGHGKSSGRKGHINRFQDYLSDLSQFIGFIKDTSPNAPVFLVGQSFGAQLILNFVVRYAKNIRGVVAISPTIKFRFEISKWRRKLLEIGTKWFPVLKIKNSVNPEFFSHDRNVVESYRQDSNVSNAITYRCGQEILKNSELVMALASRVHLPVMILQGSEDRIAEAEAAKKFYMRIPVASKQLQVYPGLYHELLNESEKTRVFNDIEGWIQRQLNIEYRLAGAGGRKGG